jgi:5-enolpyruvylshikimate-3-phosphate synthase
LALGANVTVKGDTVTIDSQEFMKAENPVLKCRESGSTLRFFIPLALCLGRTVTLCGSERLFERPLDVYEQLCSGNGFSFSKNKNSVTVCGRLESGAYKIRGDISSQFITGLILALVYLGKDSSIEILPPFESRSYIDLTISALKSFGIACEWCDEYTISVKGGQSYRACEVAVEGDYSGAAFPEALNLFGSDISIEGLNPDSIQGDRVYKKYFETGLPKDLDAFDYKYLTDELDRQNLSFAVRMYIPQLIGDTYIVPPKMWPTALMTEGWFKKETRAAIMNFFKKDAKGKGKMTTGAHSKGKKAKKK